MGLSVSRAGLNIGEQDSSFLKKENGENNSVI